MLKIPVTARASTARSIAPSRLSIAVTDIHYAPLPGTGS